MRSGGDREETGAVALFLAVTVSLLILVAAFAVDLGMQRVARRDMQALADVVALDVARSLGGKTIEQLSEQRPSLQALAEQSRDRNDETLGATPEIGLRLGELDASGSFVEVTAPDAKPTAVEVTARTTVDFSFVGGEGGAVRSAVAVPESVACFSVGAVAASLNTAGSPLLSLLNRVVGVDLTAISAGGIADLSSARIPLLALATALEAGSLDALVSLRPITVGRLALAMAEVLSKDSARTASVALLNGLAETSVADIPLRLGDILRLDSDTDAALMLDLNALEMLTAGLFVAGQAQSGGSAGTEANAIGVPELSVAVPPAAPLLQASVKIGIIEPPVIACGAVGPRTKAESAQVRLYLSGRVLRSTIDDRDGFFDQLGRVASVGVDLTFSVGQATGELAAIRCDLPAGESQVDVDVQTALLRVAASVDVQLLFTHPEVSIPEGAVGTTAAQQVTLSWPGADAAPPRQEVRSSLTSLGLVSLLPRIETGLSIIDWLILQPLRDLIIKPLLSGFDFAITPLADYLQGLLGLSLAGVDVQGEARPDCNSSKLRG